MNSNGFFINLKYLHLIGFLMLLSSGQSHAAMHLSDNQRGDAFLVTFSNQYNLAIIKNHTTDIKAIKINIRQNHPPYALFSGNAYLEPYGDAKVGNLGISTNLGCLDPITAESDVLNSDTWLDTRSATVEIIEMGVYDRSYTDFHCVLIDNAWRSDGMWTQNPDTEILPPTGNLEVYHYVDPLYKLPVVAIKNFLGKNNSLHTHPEEFLPNLNSGIKKSLVLDRGQAVITEWPTGYEAVSALLMNHQINTHLDTHLDRQWILTFPTAYYHLNNPETTAPFEESNQPGQPFYLPKPNTERFSLITVNPSQTCLQEPCYDLIRTPYPDDVMAYYFNPYESTAEPIKINQKLNSTTFDLPGQFIHATLKLNQGEQGPLLNNRGLSVDQTSSHIYYGLPVFSYTMQKNTTASPTNFFSKLYYQAIRTPVQRKITVQESQALSKSKQQKHLTQSQKTKPSKTQQ